MEITITGLEKLRDGLRSQSLSGPMRRFLERSGIKVASRAKSNAPVDQGQLRSAITHELEQNTHPLFVKIGIMGGGDLAKKAAAMEWGTGTQGDGPNKKGGVHFPPWGDRNPGLETWARRHGIPNGFLVARAIGKRGGLKPRRYLRKALSDSTGDIKGYADRMGDEIRRAIEGGG